MNVCVAFAESGMLAHICQTALQYQLYGDLSDLWYLAGNSLLMLIIRSATAPFNSSSSEVLSSASWQPLVFSARLIQSDVFALVSRAVTSNWLQRLVPPMANARQPNLVSCLLVRVSVFLIIINNNNNNDIYRAQTSPTQQMRQISRCMHWLTFS